MVKSSFIPPVMSRQSFGALVVDVTTDPLIGPINPIEGIEVTVKRILPSGNTEILAELLTNKNGQTPTLTLDSPPNELTQEPGSPVKPYDDLIVEARGLGYIPTIINGTQLFADTTSIQPIRLTPSSPQPATRTRYSRQQSELIAIGEPTLFGDYAPKIPEAEIKDTNSPGFIVLDSVVVPEFVIVHAGLPNTNNVPNYTIAFKDYIKNVASSEIYPTWSLETIRANCIAITSFTLNRVYTEWYRNKGKNFTITNSTAFDHAFFFGRDIFDSISKVVDDIFNNYIKRPDVIQPLLTQYCDGAKVSCPNWMTQWGSKKLGDDGLSASEILKYYYGQDISIQEAPTIVGIPESYPGSPLRLGDNSKAVRTLQEQLNRISKNYPLIPKVKTNGIFDDATQQAVKTFQEIFHLTADGIVGKDTWYKISEIFVAVTKIGELLP